MQKKIGVGSENFDRLINENCYFVDKSELIYELAENTHNSVTLFTRPRRFGKTLTMSMIESFFDITRDSKEVFDVLNITKHEQFCADYMNKYPVLFVSFKDVEGLDFESALEKMRSVIANKCNNLLFLADKDKNSVNDLQRFKRLASETATNNDIQNSLITIMSLMYNVYGKRVILLIDEYDVPLAKAHANGYYREMLDVIRGIMSISLKTNDYLNFAVVTGCLRIPKESIFTGVNNFASYSVLDYEFSEYFGFTREDVAKMLEDFDLSDRADIIKEWYDGYVFGDTEVYCPWDVVNYVAALLRRRNAKPKNYWMNTSGNDAVRRFFGRSDIDVSRKFETLLNGGAITEHVTDQLSYDNAYETESSLWSILLMTGYVTIVPSEDDEDDDWVDRQLQLRIPNREIAGIFRDTVVEHFRKTVDLTRVDGLMNALWDGDTETASRIMSELLLGTISYNDYHEDYYHAFLTGIFVGRGYEVQSNKERGLGRPDIQLIDNRNFRVMIIEAKKSAKAETMADDCREGLQQIIDNDYAAGYEGYSAICYGVAFFRKTALVMKA